jgi:glucose/arabinose dehydrogenase/PKD repeat protein
MFKRVFFSAFPVLLLAGLLTFFVGSSGVASSANPQSAPTGFSDEMVLNLPFPTSLAFTPENKMLISGRTGILRVYDLNTNTLLSTPAIDLSPAGKVCYDFERGLLGVTVDPDFSTNHYVYFYYTFNKTGANAANCPYYPNPTPVNRVSRFTLLNDVINPASETVLIDNIPSPGGNHNAGDLHFGQDGYLYISVGDGGASLTTGFGGGGNENARRLDILSGKILRITRDGTIPADNPYASAQGNRRCGDPAGVPGGTGPCNETFAWGLRNPFRFTFKPGTNTFYINDVGQDEWEEIDLGQSNADYGWNVREGHCANGSTVNCGAPPAGMTNPIFDYPHPPNCNDPNAVAGGSITGGAFVPVGVWPSSYDGFYLFSDYVCDKIFLLNANNQAGVFATPDPGQPGSINGPIDLVFGPYNSTQALYYTTFYNGGQIRRILYRCDTGAANCSPTARLLASPTSGPPPLNVSFDGSASFDPNPNDTLSYIWDFGDNSAVVTTTTPTNAHTYTSQGTYTASLKVRDNNNAYSVAATVKITVGNTSAPVPTIISPVAGTKFKVGQLITLIGSASDVVDGPNCCSFSWTIIKHHASHTHPFYGPVIGNNLTPPAMPAPEDLLAATNSYLEIQLTATNSRGISATVSRVLNPRLVDITFDTVPANLNLTVNTTPLTARQTIVSWEGYVLNVVAANQGNYTFSNWSDGGAATHDITTPANAASYIAVFNDASCNRLIVTESGDGLNCGTLRYAVANANPGDTIGITHPAAATINLNDTLILNKTLTIQGVCTEAGPQITLNGASIPAGKNGLQLQGGVTLRGVKLTGFKGINTATLFKFSRGSGTPGNQVQCVKIGR